MTLKRKSAVEVYVFWLLGEQSAQMGKFHLKYIVRTVWYVYVHVQFLGSMIPYDFFRHPFWVLTLLLPSVFISLYSP